MGGAADIAPPTTGPRPYSERVERDLAPMGSRPPAARWTATSSSRRSAVARLVVAGETNREVASELVVSAKTVGYHLGNLYTPNWASSPARSWPRASPPSDG